MNNVAPAPRNVKAVAVLFAPSFTRRLQNPAFGLGIARPDREKRVGYSAAEAQWWAENSPSNRYGYDLVGPTDADLDAMARESAELDRACRGPVF